ncbi:MAG: SDR family NAD(P)-dependent oxidoreductase [Alphaproteobacteria bacterium]|nr:SDR family NAD(P)-dependent oxidoreductase [Alphaproteobacteria bacterium]
MKKNIATGFDGKVALVIGASRGIGRAVAHQLALKGAKVMAVARSEGGLTELDDAVRAETQGRNSIAIITADITAKDTVPLLFANILNRFGHIDILVGCSARLGTLGPLGHAEEKDFDRTIALNLTAYHRLVRYGEPLLRRAAHGRVVFITSGVTTSHPAFWGSYTVSKAGLEALGQTWAHELQKTAITVNLINPGGTRTAMRAEAFPGEDPMTLKTPDTVATFILPFLHDDNTISGKVIDYQP